jgi:hypothetical protein
LLRLVKKKVSSLMRQIKQLAFEHGIFGAAKFKRKLIGNYQEEKC